MDPRLESALRDLHLRAALPLAAFLIASTGFAALGSVLSKVAVVLGAGYTWQLYVPLALGVATAAFGFALMGMVRAVPLQRRRDAAARLMPDAYRASPEAVTRMMLLYGSAMIMVATCGTAPLLLAFFAQLVGSPRWTVVLLVLESAVMTGVYFPRLRSWRRQVQAVAHLERYGSPGVSSQGIERTPSALD